MSCGNDNHDAASLCVVRHKAIFRNRTPGASSLVNSTPALPSSDPASLVRLPQLDPGFVAVGEHHARSFKGSADDAGDHQQLCDESPSVHDPWVRRFVVVNVLVG